MQFTSETVKHSAINNFKTKTVEITSDNEVIIKCHDEDFSYCITVYKDWHVRFVCWNDKDRCVSNYKVYFSFDLIKLLKAIKTYYIDDENFR